MGWLSAAIGGTFGIVENMMNRDAANSQARKQFNREQFLMDKSFAKDVEMWNMQNEYNSPKAQMERLQEAGLNPNLMYSNGNVGNATSMPTMTKGNASKGDTVKSNILSNIATVMQMENLNAQNKLINAQTVEAEERAKGVTLDNIRKGIDNEYLPQRYGAEIDKIKEETKNIPYANPVKAAVKSADTFFGNWNPMPDYNNTVPAPLEIAYRKNLYKRWGKDAMKHYKAPVDRRPGDFK